MVNYWLCVTNEKNWEVVKQQRVWGVTINNQRLLTSIEVGDFLVFYVKPKKLAGIFKVTLGPFKDVQRIFYSDGFKENEIFPFRVKLEPLIIPREMKAFDVLVPRLRFIVRKESWPAYLRKPIIRISEESYKIIEQALKEK